MGNHSQCPPPRPTNNHNTEPPPPLLSQTYACSCTRCQVEQIIITSDVNEDPAMKEVVDSYEAALGAKLCKEICVSLHELDVRTEAVRTAESAVGNFITDVMKKSLGG